MADRVSTIRLRFDGDEGNRDLQKYLTQYRTQMESANKLFSQAQLGEQTGVDPKKLQATLDKAASLKIAAENKFFLAAVT